MFRERRQKVIFIVAVVAIAGFVLFGYLPLRKKMKTLERDRTVQKRVISKAASQRKQMPELKQYLSELQQIAEDYQMGVPAQRDLGTFLQEIANLMSEASLDEQFVEHGKETKVGVLNCIPVNMRCKGRLEQLFEFYKALQRLDRLVRIEQVELANGADFGGEVSMKTKALIYYGSVEEKQQGRL